jgi:hypothetical protein
MTVQWGIGTGNNALGMFQYGAQLGQNMQDRRDQREDRNALIALRERQEDRLAQQQQNEQAKAQQGERRANMGDVAKLFDGVTPENYGQRVALAQQMGVDVSGVPQQFDPAWIQQQQNVLRFFNDQGEQGISGIARELVDAGFQPGTDEFNQAMRGVIQNKYASEYVDEAGNTRRRSALQLPGAPTAGEVIPPPPSGFVLDEGGPAQQAPATFRP